MTNGLVAHARLCLIEKFLLCPPDRLTTVLDHDSTVCLTQLDLKSKVYQARQVLRQRALEPGQVVAICMPSSMEVLTVVLAAWAERLAIALLPHDLTHTTMRDGSGLAAMLELIEPALIMTCGAIATKLPGSWSDVALTDDELLKQMSAIADYVDEPALSRPEDLAILQFTSGSTGMPKAVCISQSMLSSNCQAIAERVNVDTTDRMVSWLPLHHDMGLSALTLAWWCSIDLVLMPTHEFSRQPMAWLQALSRFKGTLSPAPTSAFALLSRLAGRVREGELDLSHWRYAWVGAEPVFYDHLRQFEIAFAVHGLQVGVLQPAYGMAEAVVAVSLNAPGQGMRVRWLDTQSLHSSMLVKEQAPGAPGSAPYLGNGTAVGETEFRVVDEHQICLTQGQLGRLQIRGDSIIRRYLKMDPVRPQAKDWYDTGDLGFLLNDEVFITGRSKDLITRAGVNVNPHIIEWALESAFNLAAGSVAAFSCIDIQRSKECVVVVMASNALGTRDPAELRREVAQIVVRQAGVQVDEVLLIRRSEFPKTTSGKIQRQALSRLYLSNRLSSAAVNTDRVSA
ncbi:AMP-binding protein [Pseudomonas sp. NFACC13-1]|uniref:AMP-binding protein n=1 Tax=Pseudomonas sp. NFACC13-1 TaxID=1566245 RepID=UPI00087F605D|nr:AMP-binding protein [Pseudomonas sp. NFACC13-1]SDB26188.1 Acyl-CoA synthetase (AMP-forming)/AMP-acid ligase II [Pseudomonas sp. NFACC13-1]